MNTQVTVRIPTLLNKFCLAIQQFEGWFAPCRQYPSGSRSYRNNNPGNFRYTGFMKELGATNKDAQGYCVFPSYEAGFAALEGFVVAAATDQLRAYPKPCNVSQFLNVYAPASDRNQPSIYIGFVCRETSLKPNTLLRELLKVA